MGRDVTDLERDLGSGVLARPALLTALKMLSDESAELVRLRYDGDGNRVRLAGDFAVEFGWKPKETSRRILGLLEELNRHIKEIVDGGGE